MIEQFRQYVNQHNLFHRGQKILLAVSGGIDSVVMAHLFARLDLQFGIAHCNFALRGIASDGDERFVEALAAELGCPLFTTRFDTHAYAVEHRISTQMAARELRYQWFEEIRQLHGYHLTATAHHADDDAETFFINLMRGTGLRGLQAIPLTHGPLVRPMKFATRAMIGQWALDQGIAWREDATNAETHYLRNKIRHQLLPLMEELSPGFAGRLNTTIQHLSLTSEVLDDLVCSRRDVFLQPTPDGYTLSLDALKTVRPVGFWLFELLRPFHFTPPVLAAIEKTLDNPRGQRFFSSSHEAVLKKHQLLLVKRFAEPAHNEQHTLATPADLMSFHGIISGRLVDRELLPLQHPDRRQAWIDSQKLSFPLTLRRWQKTDRFVPFGMKGTKKVSDFFADMKLTPWQKAQVWLLCDNHNQVVWIAGLRADNRFRVTPETQQVWVLQTGE